MHDRRGEQQRVTDGELTGDPHSLIGNVATTEQAGPRVVEQRAAKAVGPQTDPAIVGSARMQRDPNGPGRWRIGDRHVGAILVGPGRVMTSVGKRDAADIPAT